MSTTYVILLHGDERAWVDATPEQQADAMAKHDAFGAACAEAGHTIVGGEELAASAQAIVVRPGGEVTEGPYTETSEWVGGYYVVSTDDVQGLAALVAPLLWDGEAAEIRPVVDHSGEDATGATA